MPTDMVSGEEFSRWMNEQSNFRTRLETRMLDRDKAIMEGIGDIKDHLAELNGKTARNQDQVISVKRDLSVLKKEGCAQYRKHTEHLHDAHLIDTWSRQKKLTIVGALVGSGALLWPALTETAKAVRAWIEHVGGGLR